MEQSGKPFCSQPWSTLYIQWDGKVTRPCIRGPQNLGDLDAVDDIETFWNGASLRAVRRSIVEQSGMNVACRGCHANRSRLIDHLNAFGRNIGGDFGYDKVENYYMACDAHTDGALETSSRPVVIVMDISSKCHIRCPKCFVYNSDMQYNLGHMPEQVFKKITPLFKTALEVIGHENGECMLHKNFFDMVEVIKNYGCRFMFNTTGQLIDDEKAKRLVDLKVDKIMFSIDAIDPETYSYLHKGGTYRKLMEGIEAIKRYKIDCGSQTPRLGWYFVACNSNIDQLEMAAQMAVKLGFGMMYVSNLNRPNGEQWRTYFDYYKKEGLLRDSAGETRFAQALGRAREIALAGGLEFFTS